MPTKKSKLVRTKKFQRDIDNRIEEFRSLLRELRRFLKAYETADRTERAIIEEKIETLLLDLDGMTRILYRHRKYYEEIRDEFTALREAKLKEEGTSENGGAGCEGNTPNDG